MSGQPGTGKGNHIKQEIKSKPGRYMIVQPTIELITEFSRGMVNTKVLHSESFKGDLLTEINMHLSKEEDATIFITDKMFYKIDLHRLRGWKIFIDDCVDFCTVLSRNKGQDNIEAIYEKMFITGSAIEIDGEGGTLDKMYLSFDMCPYENVSDDMQKAWEFYNQLSAYHRRGIWVDSLSTKSDKIVVWGDYDISAFADPANELDITYLANDFEQSLIYKAHQDKFRKVEYTKTHWKENNNSRLVVNYFIEGNRNGLSKNIMKNKTREVDAIAKYINANVTNYYWTKNEDNEISFSLNGEKVSVVTRGINTLQGYTSCAWFAAMNPSDVTVPHYMNIWDLTSADLRNMWTYETFNQFVYRGIIRDYNSTDVMNVYVYDDVTAHTIPSATYNYIDIGLTCTEGKLGRPEGTIKYKNNDKALANRFYQFKNRNKNTVDLLGAFAEWRDLQEKLELEAGQDWQEQLNRYYEQIKKP